MVAGDDEATSSLEWPQMTGRDVSAFFGFTDAWLWKLQQQGYVRRLPNKLFDLGAVAKGYIAFLTDDDRRTAKTESRRTLIGQQVEKLRIENAKQLDSLVRLDDAEQTGFEILRVVREELQPVSKGSQAGGADKLEQLLAGALGRCEKALVAFFDNSRKGIPTTVDADDAACLDGTDKPEKSE